jgi:hypothetical protein
MLGDPAGARPAQLSGEDMNATTKTLGLAFALSIAALGAACASPKPAESAAKAGEASAAGAAPSEAPGGAASAAPHAAPAASEAPQVGAVPAGGPATNTPVGPSKYIDDVKRIGIDLKKATELEKIGLSDKKKLMPFFQKSMGYDACTGCHAEGGDYKQVTRNMKITRGMWKSFVVALRDDKGNAVFCDSCHQGKAKVLNRSDKKALQKFMEDEYEHKLTRADKKDNACTSCHGDEMETKIIEKIWKIAAK